MTTCSVRLARLHGTAIAEGLGSMRPAFSVSGSENDIRAQLGLWQVRRRCAICVLYDL